MTLKEMIEAEIEHFSEEQLEDLYKVVRAMSQMSDHSSGPSFMTKLKNIQIEGPEDFAQSVDLYVSG